MRLDKYLAEAGVGSRSQVKQLIRKGLVSVNGQSVKKAECSIDEGTDEVVCSGEKIKYEAFVYYMLNKPAGVVSATKDNLDETVIDLLKEEGRKDIFPVGRLDKDTEGLLLLTNDGQLSHQLLSPKKHVEKEYYVVLNQMPSRDAIVKIEAGLDIGNGEVSSPAIVHIVDAQSAQCTITITEGRFHEVKRIFGHVGYEVMYLKRIRMGNLLLDPTLKCGEYRRLTIEELATLNNKERKETDREILDFLCYRQRDID